MVRKQDWAALFAQPSFPALTESASTPSNSTLVWAEVIFIIAAGIELWFGFVLETVLITQRLSSASFTTKQVLPRAFSAPHPILPVRRLGVNEELGGDTAKTADPN